MCRYLEAPVLQSTYPLLTWISIQVDFRHSVTSTGVYAKGQKRKKKMYRAARVHIATAGSRNR